MNNQNHHPSRMGISLTLGIVLGVATGNIALGLAVGIIIGGIAEVWRRRGT
jgi:hypothetical protein